ncbi:MAG: DNA primase [Gammaproteobacteria bacterium]|nr:DNA primase [Gammaproteobacteria bacterium]
MAGRISKSFIDRLLNRVDIAEIVGHTVVLKKTGRDFQGLCPFHTEKTPSFTVSAEKQFYHCFGCGAHGSAIGFVMNHDNLSFTEAVEDLSARLGLQVEYEGGFDLPHEDFAPFYSMMADAQQIYARLLRHHPARARAVDYLKRRGLSGDIARRFGIGFAPEAWDTLVEELGSSPERKKLLALVGLTIERDGGGYYDRFRDRIIFPIVDRRGRCIAFGGRVIDQGEPKYLNSPETPIFHKRRELYGLHHVLKQNAKVERILIVEGYMDVVALAQHGVDNAVATLGTATSAEHLEQLFRVVSEVIFCFDGDSAGQRASWRALEVALPLMQDGRRAGFLFLPQGHDPDSLVREAGPEPFRDNARTIDLSAHLFTQLATPAKLDSLEGRAAFVALAKPLIHKVPTGTFRQLLLERLAELAQTRVEVPFAGRPAPTSRTPNSRPRASAHNVQPVLGRAIALLIHEPKLARWAAEFPALDVTSDPGLALLVTILEHLRESPDLSSGALLETLRDSPHHELVEHILLPQILLAPELWVDEFKGALQQVLRANQRNYYTRSLGAQTTRPGEIGAAARTRLQRGPLGDK